MEREVPGLSRCRTHTVCTMYCTSPSVSNFIRCRQCAWQGDFESRQNPLSKLTVHMHWSKAPSSQANHIRINTPYLSIKRRLEWLVVLCRFALPVEPHIDRRTFRFACVGINNNDFSRSNRTLSTRPYVTQPNCNWLTSCRRRERTPP